jgi:DNA mismatch repair protein MutH
MERKEAIEKLKKLEGLELHELARKYNITIYKNGKVNKGWAGHVIERYLELPLNSHNRRILVLGN